MTEGTATSERVCLELTRTLVRPGFNSSVSTISEPDANGVRYVGGSFTSVDAFDTGGLGVVDSVAGTARRRFPKVSGSAGAVAADGSGGFFVAGGVTAVDGVTRSGAAHILANGSVDPAWAPTIAGGGVSAITVSGNTVYLAGDFTSVNGVTRNRAAAVGMDRALLA